MMPRRIAARYAEALFSLAQEQQKTEAWEAELSTIAATFNASPELVETLVHPEIPLRQKEAVVTRVFGTGLSREVLVLLLLLLRRGHEPDIATILDIYRQSWNASRHVLPVEVSSATPLTAPQYAALQAALARRTGATVQMTVTVDPELIAGLVITMGDRVIDASARTTLQNLRTAMMGAA